MNRKKWVTVLGVVAATLGLLVACGGGGSGPGSQSPMPSAATSTASGVLSAFGSVVVNGQEFATSASTAVVDGDADDASSSMSALNVGMSVDVDVNNGTASLVRYTSAVRGEVDAVDTANSTLTVMGQTVQVSGATLFAGSKTVSGTSTAIAQLSDISVGDYVIVHGVLACTSSGTGACSAGSNSDNTQVIASLVTEPGIAGVYRVAGYVENSATGSFAINGLTVNYSSTGASATTCTPNPCAFANGDFVAVRSSTAPALASGVLTLTATRINTTTQAPVLMAGTTVSLEGPVAQLNTSANTFSIRGIAVDGSALAATVATLTKGEIVEVSGTVSSSGTLVATIITAEPHATFWLRAPLDAASAGAGTITVLGQTFSVNNETRFVDRVANTRPFNLSNFATVLAAKDQLVVSGYTGATGNVATRVERIPAPALPTVAIEGVVSADTPASDTLNIGGITVTLGSGTTLLYPAAGSTPTLAGFFAAVTVQSSVVAIVGTAGSSAGSITATTALALPSSSEWAILPH